jgi:hypothetical protein
MLNIYNKVIDQPDHLLEARGEMRRGAIGGCSSGEVPNPYLHICYIFASVCYCCASLHGGYMRVLHITVSL